MYEITATQAALANAARQRAFERFDDSLPKIRIPFADAQQFLSREVLKLMHEGEADADRIAAIAIGHLREFLQRRESALRVARPSDPD